LYGEVIEQADGRCAEDGGDHDQWEWEGEYSDDKDAEYYNADRLEVKFLRGHCLGIFEGGCALEMDDEVLK
jgi:hypothetical protein